MSVAPIQTRFASDADQPALVAFIREHWAQNHVFVKDPAVFTWQYLQGDGRLNMVMAEQDGDILGVLGFIPLGRHDADLGDGDVLLALWKVRETGVPPGLGLRLLKFIQSQLQPRLIGAIGISEMVGPIYRALGYSLGKLQHAAIFNPLSRDKARVAQGVPNAGFLPVVAETGGCSLHGFGAADHPELAKLAAEGVPRKSLAYVQDRYLSHPWYDYSLRVVRQAGRMSALVVWRAQECNGARILRIVDIIGDTGWLAHGTMLLRPELTQADAEYVDLMQYGTQDHVLQQGGWLGPEWVDGLVLPNYFAPFEARNVPIKLAFKQFGTQNTDALRLYRADSDQDRPNQFPLPARIAR